MRRAAGILGLAAAAILLTGCGRRADPNAPPPASEAEKAGYLPAPDVTSVAVAADGAPLLRGQARPAGRVRATLPSGEAYGATADAEGRFELELPAGGGPVMAAISAEDSGRTTPAEGWLFAPEGGYGHAVLLRAGAASRTLSARPPIIAVVDFDAAGGAGAAGKIIPNVEVRLTLDGVAATQGRTDAKGRYVLRFSPPAGLHRLRVVAAGRSEERAVDFTASPEPPAGPFASQRIADGWRVDWKPPGGGVQTTLIFSGGGAS